MAALRTCPRCGAKLSGDGPGGCCPACLLDLAVTPPGGEVPAGASATNPPTAATLPRTIRYFGDYELLQELARGGMGVVYRARQVSLNRLVALKMIVAGQLASPAAVQRFHNEAEAAARLDHPHIVPIYEIGEYEGQHYFSMKLFEGGTLGDERLKPKGQRLNAETIAGVVATVARAVHYAHQRGILHRDLKPTNILLDEQGEPHVTDFGLAKLAESDAGLTQTAAILGTPAYMSPEQAAGGAKQPTTAADIYSLGAILYELLTGHPPFHGTTSVEILRQVCESEPAPPRTLNPQVDRDVETICLKCLSKEPQRRYGSAEMLADDLDRWRNGEPILARPSSAAEKGWRWCRGHPASAALLLMLLVGLASAPIVFSWQRHQAERNAEAAVVQQIDSYIAQARTLRATNRVGRRFESLAAITNAMRLSPTPEQREALRNEAIACLVLTDLRLVKQWSRQYREGGAEKTALWDFDEHLRLYVRSAERGEISVCQVVDDREVARLPAVGPAPEANLGFSPDGRFVMARYQDYASRLWEIASKKVVLTTPVGAPWALSPDSHSVAMVSTNGWLTLLDLGTSRETRLVPMQNCAGFRFLPDGAKILRVPKELDRVEIAELDTGKTVLTLRAPDQLRAMNHSTDGRLVAGGTRGGHIYLWNAETGERTDIDGHQEAVTTVLFNHADTLLGSAANDGEFRLWDVATEQLLLTGLCDGFQFYGNEGYFTCAAGQHVFLLEPTPHPALRLLGRTRRETAHWRTPTISPDGRLLATGETNFIHLWDAATGKAVAVVPEQGIPLFCPDGNGLIISSSAGLYRWPIERVESATNGVRFGPRTLLLAANKYGPFDLSRDGRSLVTLNSNGTAVLAFELANPTNLITLGWGTNLVDSVAISPEGRLVAIGAGQGSGVQVWDIVSQRLVKELPLPSSASVKVAFSPDGRWLAASAGNEPNYRLYRTGSWELRFELTGSQEQLAEPGLGAFSPDGEIWAIGNPPYNTHLYSTATGRRFATLEPPHRTLIASLAFSTDGATLAVIQRDSVVQLWDLRCLRQELAGLNLDWDLPPYPPLLR